jgi:hypothetical protein
MPPRVTVLGSCRVYDPFRMLADNGVVEINNKGVYGYVHYAKESVQQLRVMRGELAIPLELKPYITHKAIPKNADETLRTPENHLADTDLLVVEISSLKEIEYDGFYLQINRVREKLVKDRENLKSWWSYLYEKGIDEPESKRRERRQFLADGMKAVERNIVIWTNVTIQDAASMRLDMETIRSFYDGPILWVSHFDTKTLSGREIPIRMDLVRAVHAGAKAMGQGFFNPRKTIEDFGLDRALKDMAHYTPEFEPVLAERFRDTLPRMLGPKYEIARPSLSA